MLKGEEESITPAGFQQSDILFYNESDGKHTISTGEALL